MNLKSKTRSILTELIDGPNSQSLHNFEKRADHILSSVINLQEMIETLEVEDDEKIDLQKRLLLSIRNKNIDKFMRSITVLKKKYNER